jgi:hypothetical protein
MTYHSEDALYSCERKKRFEDERTAKRVARQSIIPLGVYPCYHCEGHHVFRRRS